MYLPHDSKKNLANDLLENACYHPSPETVLKNKESIVIKGVIKHTVGQDTIISKKLNANETVVGYASQPLTGFNYTYSAMDGVQVDVGYSSKSTGTSNDDGANSGTGGLRSSSSIAVQYTGIEGANLFFGTGEAGAATSDSDVDIYGFTYALGPITVGAQRTDIDYTAANSDLETDMFGVSFAVNDNLSISYGQSETSKEGSTVDQEISGFSIGYSMGGMTLSAFHNDADNVGNVAGQTADATEVVLSFAF